MARRRLFRKRTTWDVVKGNMHIVVTVGALFTMLYAWSGDPTPNHPAPFQAAADPVAEGTPAPESTSSLEELLPEAPAEQPKPNAPAAPVVPASQVAASPALPIEPAVARQRIPADTAPLPSAKPIVPETRVAETAPIIAPAAVPSMPDTTGLRDEKRLPQHTQRARVRQERVQAAHPARSKPSVAVAARPRPKVEKHDAKVTERDPFSCAVRKRQPCF